MPLDGRLTNATDGSGPIRYDSSSVDAEQNGSIQRLISELRRESDQLVILSGGASELSEAQQVRLLHMFEALTMLASEGRRIAVGDGGTQAGLMAAAGLARRASGNRFPLIGVAPAGEIPPRGATPIDPNHSHIVAVSDPAAPAADTWGSETEMMYWLFGRIAEGRPSVAVVANGGEITLDEVRANIDASRPMLLIEGSGRAADALVACLRDVVPLDAEIAALKRRAVSAGLMRHPALYRVVPLENDARRLRDALVGLLESEK